jgi:hypothetical protein
VVSCSEDEPGRLTHCTIQVLFAKLGVIEGSVCGAAWTEIDCGQTNNQDLKDGAIPVPASFAAVKPVECRPIRLTQTFKNHYDLDGVWLIRAKKS